MSRKRSAAAEDQMEGASSKMQIDESLDHFSRLPVEVIEHIFTFIDLEDLKECSLVNENFEKVISGSKKLMHQFKLRIYGHVESKNLDEIATLRRLYQKMVFVNIDRSKMETAMSGIQKVGSTATDVSLISCDAPESWQFLPCFPNVEKLELCFFFGSTETLSPTLFPKLKHLQLKCAHNVRIAPGIWNLQTLRVNCEKQSIEQVTTLLENQRSLDTLRLNSDRSDLENLQLNLHPDLKVRRLFTSFCSDSLEAMQEILKFGGKVKYLACSNESSEDHLRDILHNFRTVEALTLRTLPKNESFYQTATVNTKLTELVVIDKISSAALIGMFTIFPNLEKVSVPVSCSKLSELTQEKSDQLRENLNQLERFTVALDSDEDLADVKQIAQNITDLYLTFNYFKMNYKTLEAVCRNVNFLSINGIRGFDENLNLGKILECVPKLQTLQLSSEMLEVFESSILRVLKNKAKNLKFLKLQTSTRELIWALNQKARFLGIEGLSITSFNDEFDFEISNKGVFGLN